MNAISARYTFIQQVVIEAGKLAVSYYHDRNQLNIEKKKEDGQDLVTIADKNTEQFIREKIHQQYPSMLYLVKKGVIHKAHRNILGLLILLMAQVHLFLDCLLGVFR